MTQANGSQVRNQVVEVILDAVRQDRYPSSRQLDMIERIGDAAQRARLAEVLLDKIAQDRYPSNAMLERAIRLSAG